MKKNGYALQKFFEATYALVGDGKITQRLGCAHIYLVSLNEVDLPEDLRGRFRKLRETLSYRVMHFSYKPSIIRIRAPQSGKLAQEIFDIYTALRRC